MSTGIVIPRLSETLKPLAWPHHVCQRCGFDGPSKLVYWQEHDDLDRREMIFVVLCAACSAKVIEPHARLYRQLDRNEPAPGVMKVCEPCRHRDASRCRSPIARANGGDGLAFPAADVKVHFYGGRNNSGWHQEWNEEASECSGFEAKGEQ